MNQGSPVNDVQHESGSNTNNLQTYERDPTYYHPDDSVVFLVEGLLFRLHGSSVLPLDAISMTNENGGQRYPLGAENMPERLTDSSDINPIILPGVAAAQFRNYLLASVGRFYDPESQALFTDAKFKEKHNQDLLLRFLDITHISHRFGMNKIEEWAVSQLELILESMYDLAEGRWDKETLLRLSDCARFHGRPKFNSLVANFIQYFVCIWTVSTTPRIEEGYASHNLNTCVQLFKDSNLAKDDPALFGCAFICILSLGHRSATWTSSVTRGQRAVLHFAQVQLATSLNELESVMWLKESLPYQLMTWTCSQCFQEMERLWATSFKDHVDFRPNISLRGVTSLAQLPLYRHVLSAAWSPEFAPHVATPTPLEPSVSIHMNDPTRIPTYSQPRFLSLNLPGDTRPRARIRCTEPEWPLGYVDHHIQLVYQELATRYKDIASEI